MKYKISEDVRLEIAKAMVEESAPGYDPGYDGRHYAVDTDGDGMLDAVYIKSDNAPWAPWGSAVAVQVAVLYEDSISIATFDPTPEDWEFEEEDLNEQEILVAAFEGAVQLALSELPEIVEVEVE